MPYPHKIQRVARARPTDTDRRRGQKGHAPPIKSGPLAADTAQDSHSMQRARASVNVVPTTQLSRACGLRCQRWNDAREARCAPSPRTHPRSIERTAYSLSITASAPDQRPCGTVVYSDPENSVTYDWFEGPYVVDPSVSTPSGCQARQRRTGGTAAVVIAEPRP